MYRRTALICIFLQSAATADTISSLTLDWNDDGFEDIAQLDHSRTVRGRADLLLFEGTPSGPELVQVAADFARAPSHPNMNLQVQQGSQPNQFTISETGKIAGPQFWNAQTSIRYESDVFWIDQYRIDQLPARFWEGGSTICFANFQDQLIGASDEIVGDAMSLDADPLPLVYWTTATFRHLMQNAWRNDCELYQETYALLKDYETPIEAELVVDWNDDGYPDRLVVWDTYSDYHLGFYMGDNTGTSQLTWIARNLRPASGGRVELRLPPGRQGAVEISLFGRDSQEGSARVDTTTKLVWQDDHPIVSGFSVWQTYGNAQTGIDCTWDFASGKQINVYTDTWFDDPDYPAPYTLAAWENVVLADIIRECRP